MSPGSASISCCRCVDRLLGPLQLVAQQLGQGAAVALERLGVVGQLHLVARAAAPAPPTSHPCGRAPPARRRPRCGSGRAARMRRKVEDRLLVALQILDVGPGQLLEQLDLAGGVLLQVDQTPELPGHLLVLPLALEHLDQLGQGVDAVGVQGQGLVEGGHGVVVVPQLAAVELADADPPVAGDLGVAQVLHQLAVLWPAARSTSPWPRPAAPAPCAARGWRCSRGRPP